MRIHFSLIEAPRGNAFFVPATRRGIARLRLMARKHGLQIEFIRDKYVRNLFGAHKLERRRDRGALRKQMKNHWQTSRDQSNNKTGHYAGFKSDLFDRLPNASDTFEDRLPSMVEENRIDHAGHHLDFIIRDLTNTIEKHTSQVMNVKEGQAPSASHTIGKAVTHSLRDPAWERFEAFVADIVATGLNVSFKDNHHAKIITAETFAQWRRNRASLRSKRGNRDAINRELREQDRLAYEEEIKSEKPLDIPDDLDIL